MVDLRLTEDLLVEHVYKDEYFQELDLWRTARFFSWLGIVQWNEMMERAVNEDIAKRANELEAEAVAAKAAKAAAKAAATAAAAAEAEGASAAAGGHNPLLMNLHVVVQGQGKEGEQAEDAEPSELEALEAQMQAIGKEMQAAMRERDRKVIAAVMQKRKAIQARIGELRG